MFIIIPMIIMIIIIILTRELDKASALSQLILGKARIVAWAPRSDVFFRKIVHIFLGIFIHHIEQLDHMFICEIELFFDQVFFHKLSSFSFITLSIFYWSDVFIRKIVQISIHSVHNLSIGFLFILLCTLLIGYLCVTINPIRYVIQYKYNDGPMVWNLYIMLQIIWHLKVPL